MNIDESSLNNAIRFFKSGEFKNVEIGTTKSLLQNHKYLFDGLYAFAGEIRKLNISKGNFRFGNCLYLREMLAAIEKIKCSPK